MLKKLSLGAVAVIAVFLIYVGMKSPDYEVQRQITINATPDVIWPYLNNTRMADKWGPWLSMDPDSKTTYGGPEEGVGSFSSWTGGSQMGTGSATIIESIPNEKVGISIKYTVPMGMEQYSEYLLQPVDEGTVVTWSLKGQNDFLGRLMCTFVNIDDFVGGMFEKGLSNLKKLIEYG